MTTVTPPLRSIIEPAAPRHGPRFDDQEPYLRRRSTRLKSLRTPSPGHEKHNKQLNKNHSRNYQPQHNLSPPSSPISPNRSPAKRKSKRDIQKMNQEVAHRNLAPDETDQMLPTPVKTPAKSEKKRMGKSTSRILFPNGLRNTIEDIMPQRSRASLYSPGSAPEVQIYTDSNAQVPELDETEENVFYDPPHRRHARVNTRAKEMGATSEKRKELERHKDANKGMWFTFRGKKVWREYQGEDQDEYPDGAVVTERSLKRKITPPPQFVKTAYKPRTLFPEAYKKGDTTDEEAITDIEHPEKYDPMHEDAIQEKPAATPAKQRFYATPPTTARTTRSTAKRPADNASSDIDELSTSLFTVKRGKRTSPFNEWTRVKGDGGGESQEKKRKADQALHPDNSKRARSDVSD